MDGVGVFVELCCSWCLDSSRQLPSPSAFHKMGKIKKRTAKLLKNDGKGLHKTLFSRKVKSTMSLRKAAKASKLEKSVTVHLNQKEQGECKSFVESDSHQQHDSVIHVDRMIELPDSMKRMKLGRKRLKNRMKLMRLSKKNREKGEMIRRT